MGEARASAPRIGGNAAGIVEWADADFAELLGIPLDALSNKPVTRLLERTGIDVDVVDFVAERFFEGGLCRVELPFERPDGCRFQVLLEVESLRNTQGEIDRFVATAHARPPDRAGATGKPAAPGIGAVPGQGSIRELGRARPESERRTPPSPERVSRRETCPAHDLSTAVRAVARRIDARGANGACAALLDLDLAERPLPITADGESLERLIAELISAADHAILETRNAGATITLTTRASEPGRRFVSPAHAIPNEAPALRPGPCFVLEVHDTGPPLSDDARCLERRQALERARGHAARIGGVLDYATTSGSGNQALVLFGVQANGAPGSQAR